MNVINISKADICMEISDCADMADFLSEAFALVLNEYAGFTTERIPCGASRCMDSLSAKLRTLHDKI
jgi:hypothetical protein